MIERPSNPLVKAVRRLQRSAAERRSQGRFYVEGPRLVLSALDAAAPVEQVLVAPELCRSAAVTDLPLRFIKVAGFSNQTLWPPISTLEIGRAHV